MWGHWNFWLLAIPNYFILWLWSLKTPGLLITFGTLSACRSFEDYWTIFHYFRRISFWLLCLHVRSRNALHNITKYMNSTGIIRNFRRLFFEMCSRDSRLNFLLCLNHTWKFRQSSCKLFCRRWISYLFRGAVSTIIHSVPKISSRNFVFHQKYVSFDWHVQSVLHPSHWPFSRLKEHSTVNLTIPLGIFWFLFLTV